MNEQFMSGKKLSKITGISESMISDYRKGTEPTPERKSLLCRTLGIPEDKEPQEESDIIKIKEASEILGISPRLVQLGMQQDRFRPQIGLAVKCDKHWSYTPYRSMVMRWKNGQ